MHLRALESGVARIGSGRRADIDGRASALHRLRENAYHAGWVG